MALSIADRLVGPDDIDAAVARGAITPAHRDAILAVARERRAAAAAPDEEQFRLLTSFNDIFVTLAILVLLAGLGSLVFAALPGREDLGGVVAGLAAAALAWFLARYFTARRRMALPSIVLLLTFVLGAAAAAGSTASLVAPAPEWGVLSQYEYGRTGRCVAQRWIPGDADAAPRSMGGGRTVETVRPAADCAAIERGRSFSFALAAILAGVAGALAAFAHWRAFHVPITVAAGAGAVVALLFGVVSAALPDPEPVLLPLAALTGLAVFALAMRFDMSDPLRETRRSDVAFWLHLLAAPLIVHPLMSWMGLFTRDPSPAIALVVVALYLVFTAVALIVDRRALLVSALGYVIYAIATLLRGGASDLQFPLTALVIGLFLVSLSAIWHRARAWTLRLTPPSLAARLPRPAPA